MDGKTFVSKVVSVLPASFKEAIQTSVRATGYEICRTRRIAELAEEPTVFADEPILLHDQPFLSGPGFACDVLPGHDGLVTQQFYERISPQSHEAFAQLVAERPDIKAALANVNELGRRREILRFGIHELPQMRRETGLGPFNPPDSVHAMVREPIYCGDLYYGDLVAEALAAVGESFQPGQAYLDFGCSSGRVVVPLAKAYPEASFHGCDPIPSAITWARDHFSSVVDFRQSQQNPPLPYENNMFRAVYAISIWSHFGKQAAQKWLAEVHRILAPGGFLIWSTHGPGAVRYFHEHKSMDDRTTSYILTELQRDGFSYIDVFQVNGDWGLDTSEWGHTFIHPGYVTLNLMQGWSLVHYAPRRVQDNQDLYIFQKR